MIGIAIPVHNEEKYLAACLAAVWSAAAHPALEGEAVRIVVVLDACSDASAEVAGAFARAAVQANGQTQAQAQAHADAQTGLPACTLDILVQDARNVGVARAAGAAHLVDAGARWLAFTDADSVVSHDWLVMQLSLGADAVCGTVAVSDWSDHGASQELVRARFNAGYTDADNHTHIHGANLGVSAQAYQQVGGFAPLACSEDVALVRALQRIGAAIAWSAAPRVLTSARIASHARGGFGDTLAALAA